MKFQITLPDFWLAEQRSPDIRCCN